MKELIDFTPLSLLYLLLFYVSHWPEVFIVTPSVGEHSRACTNFIPVEFYSLITVCGGKTKKKFMAVHYGFLSHVLNPAIKLACSTTYQTFSNTTTHTQKEQHKASLLLLMNKNR